MLNLPRLSSVSHWSREGSGDFTFCFSSFFVVFFSIFLFFVVFFGVFVGASQV
jgi:hypothetical protein